MNFNKILIIFGIFVLPIFLLCDIINYLCGYSHLVRFLTTFIATISLLSGYIAVVGELSEICWGGSPSIYRALIRISARGVGRLIGNEIFILIIVYLFIFISFLPLILLYIFYNNSILIIIAAILGLASSVFLSTWLLVKLFFMPQVIIIERLHWSRALKRSSEIVKNHYFRVLFYLVYLLCLNIPFYVLIYFYDYSDPTPLTKLIVDLLGSLTTLLISPLVLSFTTLFYYSLRIENYDLTKNDVLEIKKYEAF